MNIQGLLLEAPVQHSSRVGPLEGEFGVQRLVGNFEVLADAAGGTIQLRNMVLALAVSGRLGRTDPTLPPATAQGLRVSRDEHTSPHLAADEDLLRNVPTPAPNWVRTLLGNVLELRYGKSLPKKTRNHSGTVPAYGSNGAVGVHDEALVHQPCLIVGRKGSAGAVNLAPTPCWPIDTTYYVVAPPGLDLSFIFILLRALRLDRFDRSTAIPGLNRSDAYALTALIPPLVEQKRIVAKVDQLMARCDELEARQTKKRAIGTRLTKSALEALTTAEGPADFDAAWKRAAENFAALIDGSEKVAELRRAIRGLAFTGRLIGHADWSCRRVEEIATAIVDCPHSTPKWTASGVVCLRTTNFRVEGLDLSEVRHVSSETYDERIKRLAPVAGDVVYSREGGILGIACVIRGSARICLGQRMMLIRPDRKVCAPDFLALMLNAPQILTEVERLTGGTASPHINVGDVRRFYIPVPSLQQQERTLRRFDELMRLCDGLEARLAHAERLAATFVEAAVRGLVA